MTTLTVEFSPVRRVGDHISMCPETPAKADMMAVYIRAPLAMHVRDFDFQTGGRTYVTPADYADSFLWARDLAKHIGAEFFTYLPHYAIEPQRDAFAGTGEEGTNFQGCHEHEATQWALFYVVPLEGAPGNADLINDYPTRAAAEQALEAAMRGQPIPKPQFDDTAAVRAMLEARGYSFEHDMAGDRMARTYRRPRAKEDGAFILITTTDGGGLPDSNDYMICVYRGAHAGDDPFVDLSSDNGTGMALVDALAICEATARGLCFAGREG